jgi:hypothetical protein
MNSEIKEVLETCFDYMNKLNAGILTQHSVFSKWKLL